MKSVFQNLQIPFSVLAISGLLLGCGSSGGGGSKSKTGTITAAAGGTISLGDLTLEIPAGALAEDSEITIRKIDPADLPDEFSVIDGDSAYELTPDGLEFMVPATAVLKLSDEPVQGDGSLVTGLPPLMITSDGGELELLDDLTINVDADANRSEATGLLDHFSHVLMKHPETFVVGDEDVEVETITITVSGVPDSHPVEEDNPFTAIVTVSKNGEIGTSLDAVYNSMPSSPVTGSYFNHPLAIYGQQNSFDYDCIEAGTGFYQSGVDLTENVSSVAGILNVVFGFVPEGLLPAELGASFSKSVVCTVPGEDVGGGQQTTFPNRQFSAVGTFTFLSANCPLIFPDFTDDTYLFTTLGGDITIFQGSTLDTAKGLIDAEGNFSAQQIKDEVVIEDYTNGKCTIAEPFSCTADYMYLATDPQTQEPCPTFWDAAFGLDPIQTF